MHILSSIFFMFSAIFLHSVLACMAVLASLDHLCLHGSHGERGAAKVRYKGMIRQHIKISLNMTTLPNKDK